MNTLRNNYLPSQQQKLRFVFKTYKLILFPFVLLSLFVSATVIAGPVGSLQMKLYVIEATVVPEKASLEENYMPAHITHQVDLEKRGIMFGAGPLFDEDALNGPPSAGMIIIRAASIKEAREIVDADPMHVNGIRTYSIRQWSLNEGTFNIRVNFSDQSVEFK